MLSHRELFQSLFEGKQVELIIWRDRDTEKVIKYEIIIDRYNLSGVGMSAIEVALGINEEQLRSLDERVNKNLQMRGFWIDPDLRGLRQ